MIKNYMEILVDQVVEKLAEQEELLCSCPSCLDSIKAFSLNHLKPFYVTSKTGEVFGGYSNTVMQNEVDILATVLRAKEVVEKNPKHDGIS